MLRLKSLLSVGHQIGAAIRSSTVYALSSGQGKCGVALVRVTGRRAKDVFLKMTVPDTLPPPRLATVRRIIHPANGEGLDRGLVLWFPGPHSFTGEDSCELHLHGGPAVVSAVLGALSTLQGYQPAQPGDFTKRSFYNGKLDLTAVEGLGDLIHAETEAQRKQALRQMEGALGRLYGRWRRTLLQCRATLEAYIDFSEDENIEEGVIRDVDLRIRGLIGELEHHLSDERRGERLRSGLRLAILGKPNVGKSSLLNTLTQRPAAIVSPIPGTTRDVVETCLDLGGYPVVVSDTAGLRRTEDVVEKEGVRRALDRARQADVAVVVMEAPEVLALMKRHFDFSSLMSSYFEEIGLTEGNEASSDSLQWLKDGSYVTFINKMDLVECTQDKKLLANAGGDSRVFLSLKTQEGVDASIKRLKDLCASLCEAGTAESPTLTAARHRTHISSCLATLKVMLASGDEISKSANSPGMISDLAVETPGDDLSLGLLHSEETLLVAAHYLQMAATSLGHVTGHITTEDVLDHIFSAFCIGK